MLNDEELRRIEDGRRSINLAAHYLRLAKTSLDGIKYLDRETKQIDADAAVVYARKLHLESRVEVLSKPAALP